MTTESNVVEQKVETFIERWSGVTGTERANYQLFLTQLCEILDLPQPEPASSDTEKNAYVFERVVEIRTPAGEITRGFIDLYRRGSFVCEAKQSGKGLDTDAWDKAMLRAQAQADRYVRSLPENEGRPPFILVVDVGRNIDVYAEFTRSGGNYTPFPDPRSHRIRLEDLRRAEIREQLRAIWEDPLSLDPSRRAAKVTKDIADKLARLARSLEARGHDAQQVASFLIRALFTMFSEDVGLLPDRSFTELLESLKDDPATFAPMLEALWATMNTGGFSPILRKKLLQFNGGLFVETSALALEPDEFKLLYDAALADWRYVEPAIFGTLLERALDSRERHKLGAHYTPRAYVERLVFPTVIDPLRYEWENAKAAALAYDEQGKRKEALQQLYNFQRKLAETRVLDPACGSGNFLYVTMEHMKRLEGEVLNLLEQLGETQGSLEMQGFRVDPHQFLGIEINPRAARIAELVLWIGYLQWHFRTHGQVAPPEPILRDFKNIENRDALIDYDRKELLLDAAGKTVTRWDGVTMKTSPITGELIPDESAQIEQYVYINPRKATWPQADYIVGNPPFIGDKAMRRALGEGYVDALRSTWRELSESTDFVMYWWHHSAELVRNGELTQYGFITTNSIKQTFNRRVLEAHLNAKEPISLVFAIPDHPWVDAADGAAVRIAMTVGGVATTSGRLLSVYEESAADGGFTNVGLQERRGKLFADLSVGADVAGAEKLIGNGGVSSNGVMLAGAGFIVTPAIANALGLGRDPAVADHIRDYRNGRDLTQTPRGVYVIDMFGLSPDEVRDRFPEIYQYLTEKVKPERDQNNRPKLKRDWWIFGEVRKTWRLISADLSRFVVTVETVKHRLFQFLDSSILPDHSTIAIGLDTAHHLGVLSSRVHVAWALAAGGRLGVGNDPRYNKTRCFETFPFPALTDAQSEAIGAVAEEIDGHRKRQQAAHEKLTLTNMYNVLEKLRTGEVLSAKEREVHEQGLVSILKELHDRLDRLVFDAYGWGDLRDILVGRPGATTPFLDKDEVQAEAEEELLRRLVALNAERVEEESRGLVRWLRPEYQNPSGVSSEGAAQEELLESEDAPESAAAASAELAWPKTVPEQIVAVRQVLQGKALRVDAINALFKGKSAKKRGEVVQALESLRAMGIVGEEDGVWG